MLILWIFPRQAATLAQTVSMRTAWLVHLLAGTSAFVLHWAHRGTPVGRIGQNLISLLSNPFLFSATVASLVPIEGAFLLISVVLLPWAGHSEPLSRTWRHTLRVTWLTPGCAIPLVGIAWSILTVRSNRQVDEGTMFILLEILVGWILFVILRASGIERPVAHSDRPPLCEDCGYNLSHTPVDSRCPECGTPVVQSLCPGRRRPPAWEQASLTNAPIRFLLCALEAVFRPKRFFRELPTRSGRRTAQRFLMVNIALTGVIAFFSCIWLWFWMEPGPRNPQTDYLIPFAALGLGSVGFSLTWILSTAAAVGLYCRWAWKENVMPGVAKVFCYTSGMAPLVAAVCGFLLGPTFELMRIADTSRWRIGTIDAVIVIILGWFTVFGLGLLTHVVISFVGVRQIRYANS